MRTLRGEADTAQDAASLRSVTSSHPDALGVLPDPEQGAVTAGLSPASTRLLFLFEEGAV